MYHAYQAYAGLSDQIRRTAASSERVMSLWSAMQFAAPLRCIQAYHELVALGGFTHHRPDFGITEVKTDSGEIAPVVQGAVSETPFCTLLRFARAGAIDAPRVLLVAPMSGHFATLLRGTIQTLVRDHEVYVTDWRNPRDIPINQGAFGFEDFVQHIIDFLKILGAPAHLVAVCQPTVPALAAVALMAQDNDPDQPASLTLMAGPIDARISPTKVNEFATSKPIEWFRANMISAVPRGLPGAGRKVYPGFLQLTAFMSMNMERHVKAQMDLYKALSKGEHEQARTIKDFYDEYFAVLDMTAEFYLETVERVFQTHLLARGQLDWKGRRVHPKAIRRTALFTVEGERDDICAIGQTVAAHDLCSSLRPYRKKHYMQAGVGHYGVFSGRRWAGQIYPLVRNTVLANE
jgi:poly(3-hydroxybutyrate) depolymerase